MMDNLKIILQKMCSFVGANFDDINFKASDWYSQYEWTEQQEESFKKWLVELMAANKIIRKELMNFPSGNKNRIKKFVDQFCANYGWKLKY